MLFSSCGVLGSFLLLEVNEKGPRGKKGKKKKKKTKEGNNDQVFPSEVKATSMDKVRQRIKKSLTLKKKQQPKEHI